MAFDNLLLERDDAIALVTINRPKVLNALNTQTLDELRRVVADLRQDDSVRVVILTGAGEKAFVAGADINELAVQTPTSAREHALSGQQLFDAIENLGKPVIAAINGYALGLIPGYAGTQRLPRLVGKGEAMEMILTGAPITAAEAMRIGLVNRVVPAADLIAESRALAAQLARSAPVAMQY